MALIPPDYLNTVVALGGLSQDGSVQYTATGFLYGHPTGITDENGYPTYWLFLITNRHVFERASTNGTQLHARFNRPMGAEPNIYPILTKEANGSTSWIVHPRPDADVAVLRINVQQLREDGIEFSFFAGGTQRVFTLDQARESGVSEGDGVFVLGFPLGEAGEDRNYTVVRQGIIARIQDWLNGNAQTLLIDASIFPGNSGGPVLLKPELTSIRGTKSNTICGLIGMVSSYLPYREVAVSRQTGQPRMIFEENSGLGVVVPFNVIEEAIEFAVGRLNLRQTTVSDVKEGAPTRDAPTDA